MTTERFEAFLMANIPATPPKQRAQKSVGPTCRSVIGGGGTPLPAVSVGFDALSAASWSDNPRRLWFDTPGAARIDALRIGNGRLGIMGSPGLRSDPIGATARFVAEPGGPYTITLRPAERS